MDPITALMISTSEEAVRNRTLRRRQSWLNGMQAIRQETATSKTKGVRLPRIFRFAI